MVFKGYSLRACTTAACVVVSQGKNKRPISYLCKVAVGGEAELSGKGADNSTLSVEHKRQSIGIILDVRYLSGCSDLKAKAEMQAHSGE